MSNSQGYTGVVLVALLFSVTSCSSLPRWGCSSSGSDVDVTVGYRPPGVPVQITIHGCGNVAVETTASITTFLGTFSIGAELPLNQKDSDDLMLIVRNRAEGVDQVFLISDGQRARVVADGRTEVDITEDGLVIVDVTQAKVVELFAPEAARPFENQPPPPSTCSAPYATRLAVGTQARVALFQIKVHQQPSTTSPLAPHLYLREGRIVTILDGPVCNENMYWWRAVSEEIIFPSGQRGRVEGWIREASEGEWLLEPIP
ncbi:MAG: hypothetical protein AB1791_08710 [Chloroflexota bacterium]